MPYPLVTVITPTYNRAGYLVETIQSVLNQNYPNLEYIVLDDGSQDNTKDILEQYNDKLIWKSHPNMGEVLTVNKGFEMAHGEIIGVVNSDDPLLADAILNITQFMIENPSVGVVYPDWNMIDTHGNIVKHIKTFDYSYIDMLRWHHCMPGPGTFFRKEVVKVLKGRDPQFRYVSDFDFWLRAGLITEFARLPKTLATFRVHSDSASISQTGERMAEEHIQLVNKIFNLPNLSRDALEAKKEAYSSAYYIAGCVCDTNHFAVRKRYLRKAFVLYPSKYFFEYRNRLLTVIIPSQFQILYFFAKSVVLLFTRPSYLLNSLKKNLKYGND